MSEFRVGELVYLPADDGLDPPQPAELAHFLGEEHGEATVCVLERLRPADDPDGIREVHVTLLQKHDPRGNAAHAYLSFMSMDADQWKGALGSVLSGRDSFEQQENVGFQMALRQRGISG